MTEKILEIEIFGQRYKIRVKGEEDERYIGHLTSLVDQKMHEVAVKSKSADTTKIAVLAALNIADELFSPRRQPPMMSCSSMRGLVPSSIRAYAPAPRGV